MRKQINLTEEQVKHVAKLAKLSLGNEEVAVLGQQLSEVLNYFEVLAPVKTDQIEPMAQVSGLENVYRQDKIGSCLSPEEALANTSSRKGNYFQIKAIF